MTDKKQVHIDYLIAKLMGESVVSVAEKHGVKRNTVHRIIRELGSEDYTPVQEYLHSLTTLSRRDKEVQTALIRHLYKEGKTLKQIAKFTKKPLQNIQIIVWG